VPSSLQRLATCLETIDATAVPQGSREITGPARWAAVCVLFSASESPDMLFTQRADTLRKHPLQISFPGGSEDVGDAGPCATALRETTEEIGLPADNVRVLGRLPSAEVVVSRFEVVPVVAWWDGVEPLTISPTEVKQVLRWSVSDLVNPENRVTALHPSGFTGPAWMFDDLFLWGFTARVADRLLRLGGWEMPWDETRRVPVPDEFMRDHLEKSRATLTRDPR
jgi:8-oxo-dGTP pyrophosphatase MutT (NUDIX family)